MKVMVTGGAGFIGSNLAGAFARREDSVVLADNMSRLGSAENLRALLEDPVTASRVSFEQVDVRDSAACRELLAEVRPDAVVHLASQVAVTTALADPLADFDVNARGTLNLLEAVRLHAPDAHLLFASTNKVYGSLADLDTERLPTRYALTDYPQGIPESHPLNPETPYACSKLAADTYVRDYAHTYGLRTTIFRMSCVYGAWQNGTADQGWVSWFMRAALAGDDLTIYGDGLQVRDLLHVDDLTAAVLAALATGGGGGETFNIGGGPRFAVSVWAEFGELLERVVGRAPKVRYADGRPADQAVYVSDIGCAREHLGWEPRVSPLDGLTALGDWMTERLAKPVDLARGRA